MHRLTKLLIAVAVAGVVLSSAVSAERTDKRGQYAEANLSDFEVDAQQSASDSGTWIVADENEKSSVFPSTPGIEKPNHESLAFGAVADSTNQQSDRHVPID